MLFLLGMEFVCVSMLKFVFLSFLYRRVWSLMFFLMTLKFKVFVISFIFKIWLLRLWNCDKLIVVIICFVWYEEYFFYIVVFMRVYFICNCFYKFYLVWIYGKIVMIIFDNRICKKVFCFVCLIIFFRYIIMIEL